MWGGEWGGGDSISSSADGVAEFLAKNWWTDNHKNSAFISSSYHDNSLPPRAIRTSQRRGDTSPVLDHQSSVPSPHSVLVVLGLGQSGLPRRAVLRGPPPVLPVLGGPGAPRQRAPHAAVVGLRMDNGRGNRHSNNPRRKAEDNKNHDLKGLWDRAGALSRLCH